MGCLVTGAALLVPRAVMVLIWLLTDWFARAYETMLWPFVGFLFMPYTTLAYMAAMLHNNYSVRGGWLALVIVAAIVDIGHWGEGGRKVAKARRSRRRRRS
jgi:hypothetical protein